MKKYGIDFPKVIFQFKPSTIKQHRYYKLDWFWWKVNSKVNGLSSHIPDK
jgi:hypothetical protein